MLPPWQPWEEPTGVAKAPSSRNNNNKCSIAYWMAVWVRVISMPRTTHRSITLKVNAKMLQLIFKISLIKRPRNIKTNNNNNISIHSTLMGDKHHLNTRARRRMPSGPRAIKLRQHHIQLMSIPRTCNITSRSSYTCSIMSSSLEIALQSVHHLSTATVLPRTWWTTRNKKLQL